MKSLHIAFILIIDLLWAINMVAIKESVAVIPPLLAVALRYIVLLVACALHLRIVPGRMRLAEHALEKIGEAIGDDSPDRWLTIAFTTDREWAE